MYSLEGEDAEGGGVVGEFSRQSMARQMMTRVPDQSVDVVGVVVCYGLVDEREDDVKRGVQGEDDTLSR